MSTRNIISVTEACAFQIEGKRHMVDVSVECHPIIKTHYYLSAVTETGWDLCSASGYFKDFIDRNSRIKSEASILAEMVEILDRLKTGIAKIAGDIILTEKVVKARISGGTCYTELSVLRFFDVCNICSMQSGETLSWFNYDVFMSGGIDVVLYRTTDGALKIKADENVLYDKTKLLSLYNSESFQASKLAFFKYNELRRLLGIPFAGHPARMSGLFPSAVKE